MTKSELELLKAKCLLCNRFMSEHGGFPVELKPAFEKSAEAIEKAYHNKDIRALKMASADIDDQVLRHMPVTMALELRKRFREELGINLETVAKLISDKVAKIIKRGKIADEIEYQLILNHIDEISQDQSQAKNTNIISRLLAVYENSKKTH